jgi:hypothetical protein
VYKPPAVIVPQLEPLQPPPETLHETVVFALPVTAAENCRVAEGPSFAEVGEIAMLTWGTTVTAALADLDESATDVAVSEKNAGFGGTAGAVNSPEELTVPQELPEQPIPVNAHVTAVLRDPVTVTLNCCCAPASIWTVVGDIEIWTATPEATVTVLDPDLVGSESKVAVTVTTGGLGDLVGAV